MLKYDSLRPTVKYAITLCTPKIIIKKCYLFFHRDKHNFTLNSNVGDKETKKSRFYKSKKVIKIDDTDINKILVSKEGPCGTKNSFKCVIGCNDNNVIRPLCIKLPQMIGYVRKFEGNTTMSFKINGSKLLKKCNQIWKKVEKFLKLNFNGEPIYGDNDKHIKTKIKIYGGSVNTNFEGKKMPKEKVPCKSLSIIMLDSVVKVKKKYYAQTLLEECKYEPKQIKMENLIDNVLEKAHLMSQIMILVMKQNLRMVMTNPMNN